MGQVSIAVTNLGVCDFSRLAVRDWRLWFLALMTATPLKPHVISPKLGLDYQPFFRRYLLAKRS